MWFDAHHRPGPAHPGRRGRAQSPPGFAAARTPGRRSQVALTPGRSIPSLLGRRGPFRVFWAGSLVSLLGDQVTFIAIPLVAVLVLRAGPAQMGYLVAAGWLPYLLFAIPASAWVDRSAGKRRVMIAADIGRALLSLTVPVAFAFGHLTLYQLYAVVFLVGTFSVFFSVASQVLFVSMLAREEYLEGQSLTNGARAFAFVAGPSLGGFLVQVLSGPAALLADTGSYVFSAICLSSIRPVEPAPAERSRGHLMGGIRFIRASAVMRACLAATATINLFNFAYNALALLYMVRNLHVQPALIGVIIGTGALGAVAGSTVAARVGRAMGVGRAFLLGCILFPVPLVLVPLASGPRVLVVAMLVLALFLSGFGVMVLDINVGAIFASLIPPQLRARVGGAYTVVNYGIRPVGALLGGTLGAALGLRTALLVVTVGSVAGFLWLLPSPVPRMVELPETVDLAPG